MAEPRAQTTKAERRERILRAAAVRLGSAAFDWRKGLTFDMLASETGIDRKTIYEDFGNKAKMLDALVDYCVDPDNFGEFGEHWVEELLTETVMRLHDRTVDLRDSLQAVGDLDFDYVSNDARLRAQLAIWCLAQEDPGAREALGRMYQYYDDQHQQLWSGFLESMHEAGVEPIEGLTTADFITMLTALVEGLSIRKHVDPDAVPDDLFGRLFATMTAGLFKATPDDPGSVDARLAAIDAQRRSGEHPA